MSRPGFVRVSPVAVLGVIGLALILVLLAMREKSPEQGAQDFMAALAAKDLDRLVELSYTRHPDEHLRDKWDFCVNHAAKNFLFLWEIHGSRRITDEEAAVMIVLWTFPGPVAQQDDAPTEVLFVYRDGGWKLDLDSVSRQFFPALPE